MTVDIRAKVICRLGTEQPEIISGGWSDDHAQGTGLIRTRGELILKGLYRPTLGEKVDLAYIKDGFAVRFPRSLRVLSAFADPFRRQTTIQLGCLLTLGENLKGKTPEDQVAATWNDIYRSDIAIVDIQCSSFGQATISISANFVAIRCAEKLGLTVLEGFPLTNWYTVNEFDLSPGYAQVLSDLLVSESYIGYLNAAEELVIKSLSEYSGTYTVIDKEEIIDVSSINSGELPGTDVSAAYSYKRYKRPEVVTGEAREKRDWERDETVGPAESVNIQIRNGFYQRVVTPRSVTFTQYDTFDRAVERIETQISHVAITNPSYLKWHLEGNIPATDSSPAIIKPPSGPISDVADTAITITRYFYESKADELATPLVPPPPGQCAVLYAVKRIFNPERDTRVVFQTTERYISEMALAGALNLPQYSGLVEIEGGGSTSWVYHPSVQPSVLAEVEEIEYETDEASGITKTITNRRQARGITQPGQQVGAFEADRPVEFGSPFDVVARARVLANLGTVVQTRTDRTYGVQRRPSLSERNNIADEKQSIEDVSDITFVYGTADSENVTEYRVPYSPDDRITVNTFGVFLVSVSDAKDKAARYALAQNRLAFGHRNGFSLQLPPVSIPAYPLDLLRISDGDTAAGYACNGTSWSFDSTGIICNTDALFIGGIGRETELGGSLWFPVAPGITLLGPAPSVFSNPYPEPANSLPVDETFNPLNPPTGFWDTALPTNTPAVPRKESQVEVLVPAWKQENQNTFVVRTTIDVERGVINIPQLAEVTLTTRTSIDVFELSARSVVLPTRTALTVVASPPAIREAPVECLCAVTFDVFRSDIAG
jgi:hypothetical protein